MCALPLRRLPRIQLVQPLLLCALLLLAGVIPARAETFDLYIYSYCPPSPAFCGVPDITSPQQYRDYVEDAVEEINRQWEVNGISFRPQIQNIEDNPIAEVAQCQDDPSTPFNEELILNQWRKNIASTHPRGVSILLQNWDAPGLCCSQLPINNDPDPEEIWGIRCKVSPRYDMGSVLAHELGHHFCLCHTHGWNVNTSSFMDTVNWNSGADGPLDWDGDNSSFCAVPDTSPDPGVLEVAYDNAGAPLNPQPAGMDTNSTLNPQNGHEWCAEIVQSNPNLIDDWSPHPSFCTLSCIQYANNTPASFLAGQTETTARNAMGYWNDQCRGPYVVGGVRSESFTPVQKSRIQFCRQTYRSAGTMNDLLDVCTGAGGDSDHDGICQADDNCLFAKNTAQTNRDGDALGDTCDPMPDLPDALGAILQQDDDGDGCPDLNDQHPQQSQLVVGSGFNGVCGSGVVPTYGFEGKDSDGDGLLNCEDYDDDNDGLCDEGGPLPGGSLGVPGGGCVAGSGNLDDCPTSGPGGSCHLEGLVAGCPQEWLVCLGGGCVEYFLKLVLVSDPDPFGGIVFDSFQIFGNSLYLPRLPERTLSETAKVLQGSFLSGGLAGATADGSLPDGEPGNLGLEIWSRRDNRRVAVVAEYEPGNAFFDIVDRGSSLMVTPGTDPFGTPVLNMGGSFAPGLVAGEESPRDSDGDAWPDWLDNCVLVSNRGQTDADKDGFGNLCDADLNGDRVVSPADVDAIDACNGADLSLRFSIAEPASLQGMSILPHNPAGLALAERCRAADLDEDGRVNILDSRLAGGRLGQAPGPSAYQSSQSLCGQPGQCDDGNRCTVDSCEPTTGQCLHAAACGDDNACTADLCDPQSGACTHVETVCDDGNVCTADSCRPSDGACISAPVLDPLSCDDHDACTGDDFCTAGACTGRGVGCADDGDSCTQDACDPATGQCVYLPGGCDDGNPCTLDTCGTRLGCSHTPVADGTTCNDGDLCTPADSCRLGVCVPGASLRCDDGNACTTDACVPSTGACIHGPVSCDDGLIDTVDACDPGSGMCLATPIVPPEVAPVRFVDARTLAWPATPAATHWNTYRGTIPRTSLGSRPAGAVYDHVCFESADLGGNGVTRSSDLSVPPPGGTYYYLVTGENSVAESTWGFATTGAARLPPNPCVTPP